MGRGSRATKRWANDRQRKKKDRERKRATAAKAAAPPKRGRAKS